MDLTALARPTVVLCPALAPDTGHPPWVGKLHHSLGAAGVLVVAPTPSRVPPPNPRDADLDPRGGERMQLAGWVADQAVAITAARPEGPLLLVSHGAAVRGLPALGMSQRAARNGIAGYVLVDGPPPPPSRGGQDWPDAPVLYIGTGPAAGDGPRQAALRGWESAEGDPAVIIHRRVLGWPDHR